MSVEFSQIPGFPGYLAGDDGEVYSLWVMACPNEPWVIGDAPRKLAHKTNPRSGHWISNIKDDSGKVRFVHTHRLICLAFHGEPPFEGAYALHKDDVKSDNRPGNLYWGTPKQNMEDKFRNGYKAARGERHSQAKLTEPEAIEILRMRKAGMQIRAIAQEKGVPRSTVANICCGYSWSHLQAMNE